MDQRAVAGRVPDRPRLFRTPAPWVIGPAAILGCLYLFWSLPQTTHLFFSVWLAAGLLLYVTWGARRLRPTLNAGEASGTDGGDR